MSNEGKAKLNHELSFLFSVNRKINQKAIAVFYQRENEIFLKKLKQNKYLLFMNNIVMYNCGLGAVLLRLLKRGNGMNIDQIRRKEFPFLQLIL